MRGLLLAALLLALFAPIVAHGKEHLTCGEGSFEIDAPSLDLGLQMCAHFVETAASMFECGLRQTRPIGAEVVAGFAHPFERCLAYFDCDFDVIKVTDPSVLAQNVEPGSPYALLPVDVLFRSLLTHELAHALATQTAGDRQLEIVDQEYIAAALQLELLGDQWRQLLIDASPVSLPPKPGLVDPLIYFLEPRKFATNAWQHFKLDGNGCGLIASILRGEASFAQ